MLGWWTAYQQLLRRCCRWCSARLLQWLAALFFSLTLVLFLLPQRSEWLLFPLLMLLWTLLLLLARQMFLLPPERPQSPGLIARCRYWLSFGWYQLTSLLFLLLCLVALAFSLKLAGVILRALLN